MPGVGGASSALAQIETAFLRLKADVSKHDAQHFDQTLLGDVKDAARSIEDDLAAKGSARNLARLRPLLDGLDHYSGALEVLCNGTPYLPWIWAPIKLCLKVAVDYDTAFKKLIKAYGDIGKALPRFDRLRNALKTEPDFQSALAFFYCDILEFHRQAYKYLKANSKCWKRFFDSSWARFDTRFASVLDNLREHTRLVDSEAASYNVAAVQDLRQHRLEDVRERERQRSATQYDKALSWLDVKLYSQEDSLNWLYEKSFGDTSRWIVDHDTFSTWQKSKGRNNVLWVHGIPGSGKSVLFARTVRHMLSDTAVVHAYYICSFKMSADDKTSDFLRSLAAQFIARRPHLAAYVNDEFIQKGQSPSKTTMKVLIPALTSAFAITVLAVDGLDEFAPAEQKELLATLLTLTETQQPGIECRAIVFSRDIPFIRRTLRKGNLIDLKSETANVARAIGEYVHHEMQLLRCDLQDDGVPEAVFHDIQRKLIAKADGMFLWVRLMFATLQDIYSAHELERAVDKLPGGLEEAYGLLLQRIREDTPRGSFEKAQSILAWVSMAKRSLKVNELLDGICFSRAPHQLSPSTKLSIKELDRCRPLIEVDAAGNVNFVHFTAKEYLLDVASGPFLDVKATMLSIALGCVCYIYSSLQLALRSDLDPQSVHEVVEGYYDLNDYAHVYWLQHIHDFVTKSKPLTGTLYSVLLVEMITKTHDRAESVQLPQVAQVVRHGTRDARLDDCISLQPLYNMAQSVWADERNQRADMKLQTGAYFSGQDPHTPFTKSSHHYRSIREALFASSAEQQFAYLDPSSIYDFRQLNAAGAFTCRVAGCQRSSSGFPSVNERNRHEAVHQSQISCPDVACRFPGKFRNAAQLRKHAETYHTFTTNFMPVLKRKKVPDWPPPPPSGTSNFDDQYYSSGQVPPTPNPATQRFGSGDVDGLRKNDVEWDDVAGDVLDNFDFDSFLSTGDGDPSGSPFDANFAFGDGGVTADLTGGT